jgi:hypothetical protein
MNILKRIFNFLGGIYMAISLIIVAASSVIIGTFLEAQTESHLYAAQWTYHHPLFAFVLWLFFINILFSALRRWPFKIRHIPFLITHLGLLMIIGGTIIKNWYGVQGNMIILEGSASQQLIVPHTYALHLEKKTPNQILSYDYDFTIDHLPIPEDPALPGLKWKIIHYSPHVSEKIETWIKGKWAFIMGLPAIPVQEWKKGEPLSIKAEASLQEGSPLWDLIALRTDQVEEAIQQAYLQGLNLKIGFKNGIEKEVIPLKEALEQPLTIQEKNIHLSLHLPYSFMQGFENPYLNLTLNSPFSGLHEVIQIALQGKKALYSFVKYPSWKKSPDLLVDLERKPLILLLEDLQGNGLFCAFDPHGRVYTQSFEQADLHTIVVYDQGFSGYAAQAQLPFSTFPFGREEKEQADFHHLLLQFQNALASAPFLIPPLQLFKKACDQAKVEVASTFLEFLFIWHQSASLLLSEQALLSPSLKNVLQQVDWTTVPTQDKQACSWITRLIQHLELPLNEGKDLLAILERNKWPFISLLRNESAEGDFDVLSVLSQQIFSVIHQLPVLKESDSSFFDQASLLSAYFLAYGIQYPTLLEPLLKEEENPISLILETPITLKHRVETPLQKLENNRPRIGIEISLEKQKQVISLAYDPVGTGLKWPVLNGNYTLRFQPQIIQIPHRIRLRQARQINYANSNQPFSYESDILIDGENLEPIEKTLSMNHVYETWDGYRFYLSGMSTLDSGIKQVQLVVNHDPAKYYLTYPGALIVSLGIILLFWMRPYRKKKSSR